MSLGKLISSLWATRSACGVVEEDPRDRARPAAGRGSRTHSRRRRPPRSCRICRPRVSNLKVSVSPAKPNRRRSASESMKPKLTPGLISTAFAKRRIDDVGRRLQDDVERILAGQAGARIGLDVDDMEAGIGGGEGEQRVGARAAVIVEVETVREGVVEQGEDRILKRVGAGAVDARSYRSGRRRG